MVNLKMTVKEAKLLLDFLEDYSDRLGNDGCNDWEFPKDWTEKEKKAYIEEYHIANKSSKRDREDLNDFLFNSCALYVFEDRLKKVLKKS